MDSFFKSATMAAVAPQVLKRVKWQWIVYGAAAYFALKYLNKRGIFAKAKKPIRDFIDVEASAVQEKVDLGDYRPSDVAPQNLVH